MIQQNSIERLKDSASIGRVISKWVTLDKHQKACCPFHDEKSASFSVDEKKQIFKCFGCGEGGDVFSFVQKIENCDFVGAVERVAEIEGFVLDREPVSEEQQKSLDEKSQMYVLNGLANGWFKEEIFKHPKALEYMANRGYSSDDIFAMEIGYAPESWDWLKNKIIAQGQLSIALKLGLIRENENGKIYDFFRDRIVFPIKNKKAQVIGFTARYIGSDEDTGKKRKYMNSTGSAIYDKSVALFGIERARGKIAESKSVYVVEGSFDVTSAHLVEFVNVVATCGTSLQKSHLIMLKDMGAEVIYLFRDDDKAGQKASMDQVNLVLEAGLVPYICTLNDAKDLDEKIMKERVKA